METTIKVLQEATQRIGNMTAGSVSISSDGWASSQDTRLINTGTRFDVIGRIFVGFGASSMTYDGWVLTSQGAYCVFGLKVYF